MKKLIAAVGVLGLFAFAAMQVSALDPAHDFTSAYTGAGGDYTAPAGPAQACNTCHTPHNAPKANPLWARSDPAGPFTMYAANGTQLAGNSAAFLGSKSGMCLSCHDGVTNIGGVVKMAAAANANFGTDLSDDHPIGVEYPAAGDFTAKASMVDLPLETIASVDYVTCATCHDPHKVGGKMVRKATGLCVYCHTK